jgi:hypothetical protein
VWNKRFFLNNEFKIVWKESIMTLRKIQTWKWPGRTEENKGSPVTVQRLDPETS